jgi:hypothetical protein
MVDRSSHGLPRVYIDDRDYAHEGSHMYEIVYHSPITLDMLDDLTSIVRYVSKRAALSDARAVISVLAHGQQCLLGTGLIGSSVQIDPAFGPGSVDICRASGLDR